MLDYVYGLLGHIPFYRLIIFMALLGFTYKQQLGYIGLRVNNVLVAGGCRVIHVCVEFCSYYL